MSNPFLDAEYFNSAVDIARNHFEKGARTYAEFAMIMIEEFGNSVHPYLLKLWTEAKKEKITTDTNKEVELLPVILKKHPVYANFYNANLLPYLKKNHLSLIIIFILLTIGLKLKVFSGAVIIIILLFIIFALILSKRNKKI